MNLFSINQRPLFPNGTNLASFITRSFAYLIDNFVVFTIRYIFWSIFNIVWFYEALQNFIYQFKSNFSYTISKPIRKFEYVDMYLYFIRHSFFVDFVFVVLFIFSIGTIYYLSMHKMYNQTLGKMALNIKLVDFKTENPLSFTRHIVRYVVGLIPWIIIFFVLFFVLMNQTKIAMFCFIFTVIWYDPLLLGRDRRSMHDFLTFTKVIKLRKKKVN